MFVIWIGNGSGELNFLNFLKLVCCECGEMFVGLIGGVCCRFGVVMFFWEFLNSWLFGLFLLFGEVRIIVVVCKNVFVVGVVGNGILV